MTEMDTRDYHYYAFISYNWRDAKWARWLQRRLEHYRLPSVARKEVGREAEIRPVFRYETDLRVAVLREELPKELEESRFLVVVCSPNSARPNVKGEHWVNDEVERFLKLGRADRIVPVIVAGKPEEGDDSCFPPALSKANIAGIDIRKEGKGVAIQKIVARLLGLRPDILLDRWRRDLRAARRRAALALLPALVAASAFGLHRWDTTRTVSAYYADYVDRYGLPCGIFPVNPATFRNRSSTWRFDYKGTYEGGIHAPWLPRCWFGGRRRLVRVTHIGPTGVPVPPMRPDWEGRDMILDFSDPQSYDGAGTVRKILARSRGGDDFVSGPVVRTSVLKDERLDDGSVVVNGRIENFERDSNVPFFAASTAGTLNFELFGSLPARVPIYRFVLKRDDSGLVTRMTSVGGADGRTPIATHDGIGGMEMSDFDEFGRPGKVWNLSAGGNKRTTDAKGVGATAFDWKGGPTLRRYTCYSGDGETKTPGKYGVMDELYQTDADGNVTNEVVLDPKGNRGWSLGVPFAYRGTERYSRTSTVFSNGLFVSCTQFDTRDRPLVRWDMEWTEFGDRKRISFFGPDGKRVKWGEGYAVAEYVTDPLTGLVTEARYFAEDGTTPAYDAQGASVMTTEYDGNGSPVCSTSRDPETGKLSDMRTGIAAMFLQPEDGRPVKCWTTDAAGRPTPSFQFGAAAPPCITMQYDAIGNPTNVAGWTDADCTERASIPIPVQTPDFTRTFSTKSVEYDGENRPAAEIFRDENDRTVLMIRHSYGSVGPNGIEPVPGISFSAGWKTQTNAIFGENDEKREQGGCHSEFFIFDDKGRPVWREYRDAEDKLTESLAFGLAAERTEFDRFGRRTSIRRFGADAKLKPMSGRPGDVVPAGAAGIDISYDDTTGFPSRYDYMGPDGNPVVVDGTHISSVTFGYENGGDVRIVSFWDGDAPGTGTDGTTHMLRYAYDPRWRAVPLIDPLAQSQVFCTNAESFDRNLRKSMFTDELGRSYHRIERTFDAFGNLVSERVFDTNGVAMKGAVPSFRYHYDGLQRPIEWEVLDSDMRPRWDASGVSRIAFEYTNSTPVPTGFLLEASSEGPRLGGEPCVFRARVACDDRGRETGVRFENAEGDLVEDSLGRSVLELTYWPGAPFAGVPIYKAVTDPLFRDPIPGLAILRERAMPGGSGICGNPKAASREVWFGQDGSVLRSVFLDASGQEIANTKEQGESPIHGSIHDDRFHFKVKR